MPLRRACRLRVIPAPCAATPPSGACTTLHDTLVSHDTFANGAVWTFVGAGAVGVGTLIYALAGPRHGAQVLPVVGPGAGGLVVKGAF